MGSLTDAFPTSSLFYLLIYILYILLLYKYIYINQSLTAYQIFPTFGYADILKNGGIPPRNKCWGRGRRRVDTACYNAHKGSTQMER